MPLYLEKQTKAEERQEEQSDREYLSVYRIPLQPLGKTGSWRSQPRGKRGFSPACRFLFCFSLQVSLFSNSTTCRHHLYHYPHFSNFLFSVFFAGRWCFNLFDPPTYTTDSGAACGFVLTGLMLSDREVTAVWVLNQLNRAAVEAFSENASIQCRSTQLKAVILCVCCIELFGLDIMSKDICDTKCVRSSSLELT